MAFDDEDEDDALPPMPPALSAAADGKIGVPFEREPTSDDEMVLALATLH